VRIDKLGADGQWQTVVPDGGAPGGMGRMWTIDLTGKLGADCRKLRLTTNLELFYDQVFIARNIGTEPVRIHRVPLRSAQTRRVGFAREVSPDGRLPLIYDYDQSDATAPFHTLKGAYTRYGPVEELLAKADDLFVIIGPGDELTLTYDPTGLPATGAGERRSFILVSQAFCKDMDLYTATPQTLTPLPFRAMSQYPYPPGESYPDTDKHRSFQRLYNTRLVE
jgi:hypothetical protein